MRRASGKIDPFHFLMALIFNFGTSLPLGLGLLTTLLNVVISRSGLHQRFNARSVPFVKRCLQHIMLNRIVAHKALETAPFDSFSAVLIVDSSSWDIPEHLKDIFPGSGGSASKANCKIQFCYDYQTGSVTLVEDVAGNQPDQKYSRNLAFIVQKGDLILFDLGYWKFESLNAINLKEGYFISRFNNQVNVWVMKNDTLVKIQLDEFLRDTKLNGIEMEVVLKSQCGKKFLKLRLIAFRAPEEVANVRRMKLKKEARKKGYNASKKSLELCGWSIFVTNANAKLVPSEMIRTFYRIRWCVELIFKSWKSVLQMHVTNVRKNEYRLKCELYGKLIAAVIVHTLHHPIHATLWNNEKREISFYKFWKWINVYWNDLRKAMTRGGKALSRYINSQMDEIIRTCEKFHQPSRKSSLQLIDEMISDSVCKKIETPSCLRTDT